MPKHLKLTIRSPSKGGQQQPGGGALLSKWQPNATTTTTTTPTRIVPTNLPVCIIDNGGWTVKYGLIPSPNSSNNGGGNEDEISSPVIMKSMYNATARPPAQLTVLAGDEITSRMKNLGQLSWNMSCERGMICNGETQLRIWARTLECLNVLPVPSISNSFLANNATRKKTKPIATADVSGVSGDATPSHSCTFFLLEHPFVPSVISEGVDNMLFRELGMARVCRQLGACMAAFNYLSFCQRPLDDNNTSNKSKNDSSQLWYNDRTNCCCVVDSGYSFTHVVPTHRSGKAIIDAIRRLNVGGKVLTNLLKESVTYRQWNMMDEYHIVNDAKEQLCFVSQQFDMEMALARATRKGLRWFDREYLLPDFVNTFVGSVRLPEPLQRKREMEEMELMKLEIARLDNEKRVNDLANEARDLAADMQKDENTTNPGEIADKRGHKRSKSHKSKKEKSKRSKNISSTKVDIDVDDEIDDDDDSQCDDEETQQQRLHRLKSMRDEERKRREQESQDRQALALSVERFAIPEVLFRPTDIGMDCGGIAETIVESITACDPFLRAAMYHNVLLVGGNAKIPDLKERLEMELRKLAPANYKVRVYLPDNDPASYVWEVSRNVFLLLNFLYILFVNCN